MSLRYEISFSNRLKRIYYEHFYSFMSYKWGNFEY